MSKRAKYTVGTGHYAREVRDPSLSSFAWCGQSTGERDAKRIVAAMNRDALDSEKRLQAEVRLRAFARWCAKQKCICEEWDPGCLRCAAVAALRPAKRGAK